MIRNRLLIWIITPLVAVYGLLVFLELRVGRERAIAETERFLQESTAKNAERCNLVLNEVATIARDYAMHLSLNIPDSTDEFERIFRRYMEQNPTLIGVLVAFEPGMFHDNPRPFSYTLLREKKGYPIKEVDVGDYYDFSWWDWYLIPRLTEQDVWTDPYLSGTRENTYLCTYSSPIFRNGHFIGIVSIDIDLDEIREIVKSIEPDGATYRMVNASGTFISAPESWIEMHNSLFSLAEKANDAERMEVSRRIIAGDAGTHGYIDPVSHEQILLVYTPLRETGWSLLASIPESTIMKPVYERLRLSFAILLVGLLVIILIITLVSTRLTAPLGNLAAFAKELSQGNLDALVPGTRSKDEFGQLAETFDRMATQLKENVKSRIQEETARKLVESELHVARRIQESLLPRGDSPILRREEFSLSGLNEPAKFMAGDFYDFFFVDERTLALVIADVSGKGVPAAMFMAVSRTLIRNFSLPGVSPKTVVRSTNEALVADNVDMMFVTLFYAHYDIRDGRLTYVNAGHNPPYRIAPDGRLESLGATGPLAGVFEGVDYEETTVVLASGDLCVMFTDGVTEAHATQDELELYGEARLEKLLIDARARSVEAVADAILAEVEVFARGERHDDITLLILKAEKMKG